MFIEIQSIYLFFLYRPDSFMIRDSCSKKVNAMSNSSFKNIFNNFNIKVLNCEPNETKKLFDIYWGHTDVC